MLPSSLLINLVTLASFVGAAFAVYKQRQGSGIVESAEQRARDWRDTAEQRLAAIGDRDRVIQDLQAEMKRMAEAQGRMTERLKHLEAELAELKRHDLTAVAQLVSQLGVDMATRLDRIDKRLAG